MGIYEAIGLALSFVLLSIGLAFIAKFISKRLIIRHLNRNILLTLLSFVFLSQGIHIYGGATMQSSIIESTDVLPYYFPLRANKLLEKLGLISIEKINQIQLKGGVNKLRYPLEPLKTSRIEHLGKPNEKYNTSSYVLTLGIHVLLHVSVHQISVRLLTMQRHLLSTLVRATQPVVASLECSLGYLHTTGKASNQAV